MGHLRSLVLASGCSLWRPKSKLTAYPDAVKDGGGGTETLHASIRLSKHWA
jgi:hypothetical protein